jgi:hypothetical protein
MKELDFFNIEGFDWDKGNIDKNWLRHKVSSVEIEEVFFNEPLLISFDKTHSQNESRFATLGITNEIRKLFIVFTIRKNKIRIISARDMSRKERKVYENYKKENSKI